MAADIIIPVEKRAHSRFTLALEGIECDFYIYWNFTDNAWYMNFSYPVTSIRGLKLIGGCNIFEPFALPEFGQLWVLDTSGKANDPDYNGWGEIYELFYIAREDEGI